MFRTSVFPIPPGADRKVTMRYTQLCKRDRDVVEFAYPFATQKFTAKPIRRLAMELDIRARDDIKSIYCPSHDARVVREGDHEARVTLEQRDVVPSTDFRLLYTMAEGTVGATVLSTRSSEGDDGYFLLLASPNVKAADVPPRAKTVVFVLDRSGSMAGKKIEQARRALVSLLNNLRDDDMFNIVVYDDRVESYKPELQRYSSSTRAEAVRFVENIREGGSTNIDSALTTALGMIQDDSRPNYVLFFTDGLPTAGETKEMAIAENSRKANTRRARIFAFGVGFDVNARLLDRLSGGNGGTSEYVKPDQDIEASVARFGGKLTSPVLSDIRIELAHTDVNRTYPRDLPDLFEGGQIVWVGRYRESGPTTIRLSGKVGGERRSFEFPAELAGPGRGSQYDFVEKLWAMRRVGSIIDQIDLHGSNKELTDELVALSTRYGILTPYTSFLADERVSLHAYRENAATTSRSLRALDEVTGQAGVAQRSNKQDFLNAARVPAPSSTPSSTTELSNCPAEREVWAVWRCRRVGSGPAGAAGRYSEFLDDTGHRGARCRGERVGRHLRPPGGDEDLLSQGRPLGRLLGQARPGRQGDRDPSVQRRILRARQGAEERDESVLDLRRARDGGPRRPRLPDRAGNSIAGGPSHLRGPDPSPALRTPSPGGRG